MILPGGISGEEFSFDVGGGGERFLGEATGSEGFGAEEVEMAPVGDFAAGSSRDDLVSDVATARGEVGEVVWDHGKLQINKC